MSTKGSIGKIALDAILKPATIPLVNPQQAVKLSRGIFRDMLKQIGSDRNYNVMQKASGTTPKYGEQTEKRFSAIENILKKRNSDPTPLISDAVSTGKINGMKLSSQERTELAARLQVLNAYKTGNMPNLIKEEKLSMWAPTSRLPNPADQFYAYRWDIDETPEMLKRDDIKYAYAKVEEKFPKGSALEKMAQDGYIRNMDVSNGNILETPKTPYSKFKIEDIINKDVFGLKGTYGRGYMNRFSNRDINESLRIPTLYNNIVQKYDITDKKVGETIYSLLPEWKGSIEDLIALARMLNP